MTAWERAIQTAKERASGRCYKSWALGYLGVPLDECRIDTELNSAGEALNDEYYHYLMGQRSAELEPDRAGG
jgi:hypothetical protein